METQMEPIKIVRQEKAYKHPWGDNVYGDYDHLIRKAPKKLIGEQTLLFVTYFNSHRWEAMKNFTVDVEELKTASTYECPITERSYTAILPVAIISADVKKYFDHYGDNKPWFFDMACDPTWNKYDSDDEIEGMSSIDICLLGPGYTDSCYPSDGSKSLNLFVADLDNGDMLLLVGYVWHNK
jgi:hypothetical protein